MKMFMVSALTALLLVGANAYGQDDTRVFPAASFKKLKIDNEKGKTVITGGDVQDIKVTVRIDGDKSSCVFKSEVDGDELEFEAKDKSWFGSKCQVELVIEVPATLTVDVEVESGDVQLASLRSAVEVEIGSGVLSAKDSDFSKLEAKVGSGGIKIDSKVAIGEFRLGSGSFDLSMNEVPASGNIDLKVGSGNSLIRLPADARIHSSAQTGVGKYESEITNVADATYRFLLKSGTGDLTIKKL